MSCRRAAADAQAPGSKFSWTMRVSARALQRRAADSARDDFSAMDCVTAVAFDHRERRSQSGTAIIPYRLAVS